MPLFKEHLTNQAAWPKRDPSITIPFSPSLAVPQAHPLPLFLPPVLQRADMVADWYCEVCRRTGRLVALWQCVGWCHGVSHT